MQDSAIQNSCSEIFTQWCRHHFVHWRKQIYCGHTEKHTQLEYGPMPNVMVALSNMGGALCSTLQNLADAHYYSAVQ